MTSLISSTGMFSDMNFNKYDVITLIQSQVGASLDCIVHYGRFITSQHPEPLASPLIPLSSWKVKKLTLGNSIYQEVSFDMPNNPQTNYIHGSNRLTLKNETRTESSISACLSNCIRLPSETYHSLIKWESENL